MCGPAVITQECYNAAGNHKQPARNPVGGNQDWENEKEPKSAPSTLGIHGGAAGRFTKQATTFPEEGNKKNAGKKQEHYTWCLWEENLFYKIQLKEETNGEEVQEQWQN